MLIPLLSKILQVMALFLILPRQSLSIASKRLISSSCLRYRGFSTKYNIKKLEFNTIISSKLHSRRRSSSSITTSSSSSTSNIDDIDDVDVKHRTTDSIRFAKVRDYDNLDSHIQHLEDWGIINDYWIKRLRELQQPTAKSLISQLVAYNVVGYNDEKYTTLKDGVMQRIKAKTGEDHTPFLQFYIEEKEKHPNAVILMRNGEFYETFGIDALMLIGNMMLVRLSSFRYYIDHNLDLS